MRPLLPDAIDQQQQKIHFNRQTTRTKKKKFNNYSCSFGWPFIDSSTPNETKQKMNWFWELEIGSNIVESSSDADDVNVN